MGFDPLTLALAAGGMAAVSSIANTNAQNKQAKYQAQAAEAQADAARNQAKITAEQGRIESENIDRQRNALTREYADLQAGNVASFGALGVDMSSGSAMGILKGNASRYAQDVGTNRYQKAVSEWATRQNVNSALTSAQNYDAQASYYKSTVKGLGSTLLTAGLSGLTSGVGMYAMAGGFGGASGELGGYNGAGAKMNGMNKGLVHPDRRFF